MLLDEQIAEVQARYQGTTSRVLGNVTVLEVSPIRLGPCWNKREVTMLIVVPVGYPIAKPDCFWADVDLRLQDGRVSKNANVAQAPDGSMRVWFSWHAMKWNPNRDTLLTYIRLMEMRFLQCE